MQTVKGLRNGYNLFSSENDSAGSNSAPASPDLLPPPNVNYIEHRVSKMDTLAGVAIKYGVEVADIKRMNGLVTDLQMFALKSLQIPLPGRHPPSPILSNGLAVSGEQSTEQIPTHRTHIDILDSIQSLKLNSTPRRVSPAMSSLQGYYGLTPSKNRDRNEGTEMAVYKTSREHLEDESLPKTLPFSRSMMNGISPKNVKLVEDAVVAEAGDSEADWSNENSVRRRQKADTDFAPQAPELLLKDDNSSGFSSKTGNGVALRPKSMSRSSLAADVDSGRLNPIPMAESFTANGLAGVRKSSSTSSLQDSENGSSIWPTSKWTLKPDLQALSTAAITRPIFDGLPKPIAGRRKAALD